MMKKLAGTFYFISQVLKRKMIVFWLVLSGIFALSLFLSYVLKDNPMFLSITGAVYIFYGIMASKLIKETLSVLLRFGVSRLQYILLIGTYFVIVSAVVALILNIYQFVMGNAIEGLGLTKFTLLHPATIFGVGDSEFMIFAIDFIAVLFCMIFGLFISLVFHRFGLIGGYSLVGILILSPIILTVTELYKDIVPIIFNHEGFYVYTELLLVCLGIYLINILLMKNISSELVN